MMKSIQHVNKMANIKEEHNKKMMIENLIWEIVKLQKPDSYIDPQIIKKAKEEVIKILENY